MSVRKTSWVMDFKDKVTPQLQKMDGAFNKVKTSGVTAFENIASGLDTVSKGLDTGSKKLDGWAKATKKISLAAGGVLAGSTKIAVDHEKALNFVGVQADMTKQEMEEVDKYIKGMDKRSTSTQLLDAAGTYASAGLIKDEIIGVMQTTERLARVAGDADIATDVMLTSSVAFDLDLTDDAAVEAMGDKFAKGSALAKLEVDEINETAKTAQGTFKNMNMSADDAIASTVLLAKAGYTGSAAGTMMNSTYNDLIGKAEDGKVAFGNFKMSLYDANGQMKTMPQIMEEIEKGTADMSEEQRNAALASVFGANAQKMVNAFLGQGSDAYKEYAKDVAEAEGDLKKKYDETGETASERFEAMQSALEDAADDLGKGVLPALESVMGLVSKGAKWFSNLDEGTQKTITGIVAFVAALSPALSIGGKILGGLSKFTGIASKVAGFMAANPIVLGLLAIVTAGYLVYKNWDFLKAKAQQVGKFITNGLIKIGEITYNIWEGIKGATIAGKDAVVGAISSFHEWLVNNPVVRTVADIVTSKVNNIKGIVSGVVGFVSSILEGDWKGAWDAAQGIVENYMEFLGNIPQKVFNIGREMVQKFASATKDFAAGLANKLKGIVGLGGDDVDGSHRTGKDRIPYDNYRVNAHKGEMILTRRTAEEFRKLGGTRNTVPKLPTTSPTPVPVGTAQPSTSMQVDIPKIEVHVTTDGTDAYGDGRKAGQGVRDEIDKYFRDMGVLI